MERREKFSLSEGVRGRGSGSSGVGSDPVVVAVALVVRETLDVGVEHAERVGLRFGVVVLEASVSESDAVREEVRERVRLRGENKPGCLSGATGLHTKIIIIFLY